MNQISSADFKNLVDHTLLKPTATQAHIEKLCQEALEHHFFAVCVNPFYVPLAHKILKSSTVRMATVCDFPLGASSLPAAMKECEVSLSEGADEVDMVLNIGAFKSGHFKTAEQEIAALKKLCGPRVLKVILEICLLNSEEIVKACHLAENAGADFVKTSTGFSTGGATVEAVALMRKSFGGQIKASGGIKTLEQVQALVEAGADRLGLSAGLSLLQEIQAKEGLTK